MNYYDEKYRAYCRKHAAQPDTPQEEFDDMMYLAEIKGLDPASKHMTIIPKWSKGQKNWKVLTQIDGFRFIAQRTGEYCGQDKPEFEHGENGNLVSATITLYRFHPALNDRVPYSYTAYYQEFVQTKKDGTPTPTWSQNGGMAHVMLAKVAEANAFRKGFPEMSGLYTSEEMDQAFSPTDDKTTPREETQTPPEKPTQRDEPQKPQLSRDAKVSDARRAYAAFCNHLGVPEMKDEHARDKVASWLGNKVGGDMKKVAEEDPNSIIRIIQVHWDTHVDVLWPEIDNHWRNIQEAERVAKEVDKKEESKQKPSNEPDLDKMEPVAILGLMASRVDPEVLQKIMDTTKDKFGDMTSLAGNKEAREWLKSLYDMSDEERSQILN